MDEQEVEYFSKINKLSYKTGYIRRHHRNGGVAIYLNDNISAKAINVENFCSEKILNCVQ